MITQTRLKEVVEYDPSTGVFTWKKRLAICITVGAEAGKNPCKRFGYRQIKIDDVLYKAHRLAWLYMTGQWPEQIDHINHDRADNRWENLRNVSPQGNSKNKYIRKDNTSGVQGVGWHSDTGKWRARITHNGELIHLGLFNCITSASIARKRAEVKYGFHKNHGGAYA